MDRNALRAHIFNSLDIQKQLVHAKTWGCDVEVRGMNGTARAAVMRSYDENGRVDYGLFYPAILIATCYVPGTEERLFDEVDRDLLNTKSAAGLEELALPAMQLSGLSKQDLASAEKNSAPSLTLPSGSDS
jgi:hypothetical protein